MTNLISVMINSINGATPHLNPTEIYNEGWCTRLLVYLSVKNKLTIPDWIDFSNIRNWTSECLISSPFVDARINREGYTHADMAIGDFLVDFKKRGEILIDKDALYFGVIEAKMGSNLSQGTTNAPHYSQASRNLCCIASSVKNEKCNTFFSVVAPQKNIDRHRIKDQIDKDAMIKQIEERYHLSEIEVDIDLITRARKCVVVVKSYEDWIAQIPSPDRELAKDFYKECLKWNRINS